MFELTRFWLLHSLRQGRMLLSFMIIFSLIVINAFTYSALNNADKYEESQRRQQLRTDLDEASKAAFKISDSQFLLTMPTNKLRFFADNRLDQAPSARRVSILETFLPSKPGNGKLAGLGYIPVDLAFIFSTIIGFLALGMTFDSISGEKEQGTLKLLLSFSLPRWQIFTSKIIATTISLLIPAVAGLLTHALILNVLNTISLTLETGLLYLVFLFVATLVILFFTTLGTLVSTCVHNSVISLIISLSIWTFYVFVLPGVANYIGRTVHQVPSTAEISREREQNLSTIILTTINFANDNPEMPEDQILEEQDRIIQEFLHSFRGKIDEAIRTAEQQPAAAGFIGQFSPTWLSKRAISTLVNTHTESLLDFYREAERYSSALLQIVRAVDSRDPESPHKPFVAWIFDEKGLTANPIEQPLPLFEHTDPDLATRVTAAISQLPMLITMWLILFLAGILMMNKYDVR